MDYNESKRRVEALREELEKISAQNRSYFKNGYHTELDRMAHERRRLRVVEINSELASMLKVGRKRR